MIIDAWIQHPSPTFVRDDMLVMGLRANPYAGPFQEDFQYFSEKVGPKTGCSDICHIFQDVFVLKACFGLGKKLPNTL